jgi:hypothetical protein
VSDTADPIPDWYPDPTGRFEQRYWDGSQWTEHVNSAGQQRTDPLPGEPPPVTAEPEVTSDLPGLGDTAPDPEPTPAVEPEPAVAPVPAPDWYPDPTGRYEQRYWDGSRWTEHVTAAGQQGVDPLPDENGDLGGSATETEAGAVGPVTEASDPATEQATPEPDPKAEVEPEPSPPPADANPFAAAAGGAAADPIAGTTKPGAEHEGGLGPVPGSEAPGGYVLNEHGELVSSEGGSTEAEDAAGAAEVTAPDAAEPAPGAPAPDWYPDPSGRQELRYWDGSQWTEHASTAGRQVVDPIS